MKKPKLLALAAVTILFGGIAVLKAQQLIANNALTAELGQLKEKKVLYFDPQVFPDMDEIKEATNAAFFSAVSDKISTLKNNKLLRAETPISFDSVDVKTIIEYCRNNNADFAVVPKVKFFKVGFGKYVFSNQVVVSMKLYDKEGNFISESSYDTYKKNMRLLGSAENSVKIGTLGAIKEILRDLRKKKRSDSDSF